MNHWNLVANRLYYAVFHMASALLIDKGFTSKTHSGVICLLGQEFATKGLLDKDEMRLVSRLQNMRHAGEIQIHRLRFFSQIPFARTLSFSMSIN